MDFFRGKKITVMGLGLLGRGVGDTTFLAENGAELIVTDLKSKEDLAPSLKALKEFSNITYVLGEHRLEDFHERDFILKAAGVPLDSPFVAEAKKNGVPVEMSASLFAKLTSATIVGITGTRGKSTTTHLIHETLISAFRESPRRALIGGNVRGVATLPLLREAKEGDVIVLELDSWQLQGFGDSRRSPHIAVFTTFFPDHQNYYKHDMNRYLDDKANIFKYQMAEDVLILGSQAAPIVQAKYPDIKSRVIVSPVLPSDWKVQLIGEHNRENAALAAEAARQCGVQDEIIRAVVESYRGVPGRLERIRDLNGISFYNDTTATTPDAARAALSALGSRKRVILIMGGSDKELDMSGFFAALPAACKRAIILPGTGTEKNKGAIEALSEKGVVLAGASSMDEAVRLAYEGAGAGDIVLLSPGFASFGLFKNEFDRGDQFVQAVQNLRDTS